MVRIMSSPQIGAQVLSYCTYRNVEGVRTNAFSGRAVQWIPVTMSFYFPMPLVVIRIQRGNFHRTECCFWLPEKCNLLAERASK